MKDASDFEQFVRVAEPRLRRSLLDAVGGISWRTPWPKRLDSHSSIGTNSPTWTIRSRQDARRLRGRREPGTFEGCQTLYECDQLTRSVSRTDPPPLLLPPLAACRSEVDSDPSASSAGVAEPSSTPAATDAFANSVASCWDGRRHGGLEGRDIRNLSAASDSFTAVVNRLGCSGGVTGEVFEPSIAIDDRDIVVTFDVEP